METNERKAQIADDCVRRWQEAQDRILDREARRVNPQDDLPKRFSGVLERRAGRFVDMFLVEKKGA